MTPRTGFLLLLTAFTFLCGETTFAQAQNKGDKFIVVLDPGHGGEDPGALGTRRTKIYEKHIVLAVSQKIKKLFAENMPDVHVIMTRETDRKPDFIDRVNAANKNGAHLFVSIHCNSNASSSPYGAETFVMATSKAETNLEISRKENAPMLLEKNYKEVYKNFDPNDLESNIGRNIEQFANIRNSIAFATMAQEKMHSIGGRKDRGVKQAVLYVTSATIVPAVLVEIGFISNRAEEDFLHSAKGQDLMARSLYEAVRQYKERFYDPVHGPSAGQTGTQTSPSETSAAGQTDTAASTAGVYYCVQLTSASSRLNVKTNALLKKFTGIDFFVEKGLYKYTTRHVDTYAQAQKDLSEAKRKGAKDAFIVAFRGDEKINVAQARQINGE